VVGCLGLPGSRVNFGGPCSDGCDGTTVVLCYRCEKQSFGSVFLKQLSRRWAAKDYPVLGWTLADRWAAKDYPVLGWTLADRWAAKDYPVLGWTLADPAVMVVTVQPKAMVKVGTIKDYPVLG